MSAQGLIEMLSAQEGTTGDVYRFATSRVTGVPVPTPVVHLLGVKLNIQDKTGDEKVRYGKETNKRFAIVYAEHGADIQTGHRLKIGARTFDVLDAHDRGFDSIAYRHLECEETK